MKTTHPRSTIPPGNGAMPSAGERTAAIHPPVLHHPAPVCRIVPATVAAVSAPSGRLVGYDIARALAVLLMVAVNVPTIMAAAEGPPLLSACLDFIYGRSAALFILLAGVGVSLMARGTPGAAKPLATVRWRLFRRSLWLLVAGYLLRLFWSADILHFYGLFLTVGALLLAIPSRFFGVFVMVVWLVGAGAFYQYAAEPAVLDAAIEGEGLTGYLIPMVNDLLATGYYGFFPWFALFLMGMVMGRRPDAWRCSRTGLLLISGVFLMAAMVDRLGTHLLAESPVDIVWPVLLLVSEAFPPSPVFMISAAATTLLLTSAAFFIAERAPLRWGAQLLQPVGRWSLTIYVGHLLAAKALALHLDRTGGPVSLQLAAAVALVMAIVAMALAVWCSRWFTEGPLEWGLRVLSLSRPQRNR